MKTKIVTTLIFVILTLSNLFSQVSESWRKSYTTEIESRIIGCQMDNTNNIIVGSSVSRSGIGEFANYVIVKFNSNGDTLWRREYHSFGNQHDHLFDIYVDSHGNIYATGLSTAYQSTEVTTTRTVKYSPSGNLLWEAIDSTGTFMALPGESKEAYIKQDSNGDILICTNKMGKVYVIRYTSSGNLVWHKQIAVPFVFSIRTLPRAFEINSGNFFIFCKGIDVNYREHVLGIKCQLNSDTVWTFSNMLNFSFLEGARAMTIDAQGSAYFLTEALLNFQTSKLVITKISSSGTIWEKIYGTGNDKISPSDVKTDNDYNIIVTASETNSANNNKSDAVTIKYSSAGDSLWIKKINGFNNNDVIPHNVAVDNNNYIYVTGQYPLMTSGTQYIQKYSPAGDSLWNLNIQGVSYWSTGRFIKFDNVGNAILASNRMQGIMLTKYANATSIKQISSEVPSAFGLLQNYPNPFNPKTVIKYNITKPGFVILKIYNVTGREVETLVNENQIPGTYEINWDGSDFNSGVYFYKLSAENFTETRKMILSK